MGFLGARSSEMAKLTVFIVVIGAVVLGQAQGGVPSSALFGMLPPLQRGKERLQRLFAAPFCCSGTLYFSSVQPFHVPRQDGEHVQTC